MFLPTKGPWFTISFVRVKIKLGLNKKYIRNQTRHDWGVICLLNNSEAHPEVWLVRGEREAEKKRGGQVNTLKWLHGMMSVSPSGETIVYLPEQANTRVECTIQFRKVACVKPVYIRGRQLVALPGHTKLYTCAHNGHTISLFSSKHL